MRRLRRLIPDLPDYERGGLVVPQAVVLRRGADGASEVLLVRRTSPTAWELPGGNLELNESPEETVIREVEEETGLDVAVERLLAWYDRTGFRPHRSPVYVCRVAGGTLRPNEESYEVRFFPVAHLPLGLFPWYRPTIRAAAAGASFAAAQRQHLGVRATLIAGLIHLAEVTGVLR